MYIDPHKNVLDEAMQQYQCGQLLKAQALYESVLLDDSHHFIALHMLGVIACQQQHYEQGIELIKRALLSNPRSLSAHANLANAFERAGQDKAALICLVQFLEFEPDHQETILSIVRLLQKLLLDDAALVLLDKAIALKEDPLIYTLKGNIFLKQKKPIEALHHFNKAILLKPDAIDAYANAGTACMMLNNPQEALNYYDKALAVDPHHEAVRRNKALALHAPAGMPASMMNISSDEAALTTQQIIDQVDVLVALGQAHMALTHIQQAILKSPQNKELYNQQGVIYLTTKQYQEALDSFNDALAIDAYYVNAIINSATALMGFLEYERAIEMCQKALLIDADNVFAMNNIGSALVELNRRDQALSYYDRVIELTSHADAALLNASFCYLAMERYAEGWPLYEARWKGDLLKTKYYIPKPPWTGREPLKGKTIFLYGEQGFGDSFQFVRYVNLVDKQGATILLGVNDSIQPLFKRSFPYVELTSKEKPLPDLDYYCPLGSLPLAFNTTIDTIPNDIPYLVADKILIEKWRKKLTNQKIRVGIAWRGNSDNPVEVKRSLPLSLLMTLAQYDVSLVSLKIDPSEDEKVLLDQYGVIRVDGDINTFDDTAALIENLDLIISTDTSVAHLAGALGKPVWILLAFSSDWRWHINRQDSPWYPSARLFRQPALGDWHSVIDDLTKKLQEGIHHFQKK